MLWICVALSFFLVYLFLQYTVKYQEAGIQSTVGPPEPSIGLKQ